MPPHDTSSTPPEAEDTLPAFLTVEEAAAVLRIGRTAAYALTQQLRATNGAQGLPVIQLGRLLRVPRHELERLAAGTIDTPQIESSTGRADTTPAETPNPTPRRTRTRTVPEGQPTLFEQAS